MRLRHTVIIFLCLIGLRLAEFAPNKVLIKMKPQSNPIQSNMRTRSPQSIQSTGLPADVQNILNGYGQAKTKKVFDKQNTSSNGGMGIMAISAQEEHPLDRWYAVEYPDAVNVLELIKTLKDNPNVAAIQPSFLYKPSAIPNDPEYGNQWHLPSINAPAGWDIATGSSTVTIAIIDTGVQLNHPDLVANIVPGYDFVGNDSDASPDPVGSMNHHGTVAAGLAAARGNNGIGVAGVNWNAKIMPLKVFGGVDGGGYTEDIVAAIYYAVDNGADVINMSLGAEFSYAEMAVWAADMNMDEYLWWLENQNWMEREACYYAYENNVVVVASAGNGGENTIDYPAAFNSVIAVGSLDKNGNISDFSSTGFGGKTVELVAPGEYLKSTNLNSGYTDASAYWRGTSYTAPQVSGLAALLKSKYPNLTSSEIRKLLYAGTEKTTSSGWFFNKNDEYGYGKIDVRQTLIYGQIPSIVDTSPPGKSPTNKMMWVPDDGNTHNFNVSWDHPYSSTFPIAGYHFYFTTQNADIEPEKYETSQDYLNGKWRYSGNDIEYLRVRAVDELTQVGEWTTVITIRVDRTAPVVTTGLETISRDNPNPGKRTWNATDVGMGVSTYNIYWGKDPVGTDVVISQSANNYTPACTGGYGVYYLRVQAVDEAGNIGEWKTILEYHYDKNWGGNSVRINNGAEYTNNKNLNLSIDYENNTGIVSMSIQGGVNPVNFVPVRNTYALTIPLQNRLHIITVNFYDAQGVKSPDYTASITLDTVSPNGSFVINDNLPYTNKSPVTLNIQYTDNISPVASMNIKYNNVDLGWEQVSKIKKVSFPLSSEGIITFSIRFADAAGNISDFTEEQIVIFDTHLPVITTRKKTQSWTSENNVEKQIWEATDNLTDVTTYNVYWGKSEAIPGNYSTQTAAESDLLDCNEGAGIYYLQVQAIDGAGNASSWKTLLEYRFDNIAPTMSFAKKIEESRIKDHGVFSWSLARVTENSNAGLQRYDIHWGTQNYGEQYAVTDVTSNKSYNPPPCPAPGIYYLRVRPVDFAGNIGDWLTVLEYKYDPALTGELEIYTDKTLRLNNTDFTSSNILELRLTVNYEDCNRVSINIRINNQQIQDWTQLTEPSLIIKNIALNKFSESISRDGTKTVEVLIRNDLGSQTVVSKSIVVDTTHPRLTSPALKEITGGDKEPDFTLAAVDSVADVDMSVGVKGYYIYWGTNPDAPLTYMSGSTFIWPCYAKGTYYLRISVVDQLGNQSPAETRITYHYAPVAGTVSINAEDIDSVIRNGVLYVKSNNIELDLSYDNAVAMSIFCNNQNLTGEIPVAETYPLTLSNNNTLYTIKTIFKSAANVTGEASTKVYLDTTPPVINSKMSTVPSIDVKDHAVFDWNSTDGSGAGIAGYYVYWGMNRDGTDTEYVDTASYDPPPCAEDGTYYLRVRPVDALNNIGQWSTVLSYTYDSKIDDAEDDEDENEEAPAIVTGNGGTGEKIYSYPNPFSPASGHTMKIAYEVEEAGWNKILVYNIRGQKIWQADNYSAPDRNNTVSWDGRDARGRVVGNGTYILILMDERNKIISRGRLMLLD